MAPYCYAQMVCVSLLFMNDDESLQTQSELPFLMPTPAALLSTKEVLDLKSLIRLKFCHPSISFRRVVNLEY